MASLIISSSSSCTSTLLLLLLLFLAVPTSTNASLMETMRSFFRDTAAAAPAACPDLACCHERWSNVSKTKGLQFHPGDACDGGSSLMYSPEFQRELDRACHCYHQHRGELLLAFGDSPVLKLLMRTRCIRSTERDRRMLQEFCDTYKLRPPPFLSPEEMERSILMTSESPSSWIPYFLLWALCISMCCIRVFQMLLEIRTAKNKKEHKY